MLVTVLNKSTFCKLPNSCSVLCCQMLIPRNKHVIVLLTALVIQNNSIFKIKLYLFLIPPSSNPNATKSASCATICRTYWRLCHCSQMLLLNPLVYLFSKHLSVIQLKWGKCERFCISSRFIVCPKIFCLCS